MTQSYDAIVVGGGHNGLTCAAYLAKAGRKVLVLEQRYLVGGAAVSEEKFPGFKFTVYSYVVSLLRPEVIRELELAKHGLQIVPLDAVWVPMENGDELALYSDPASLREEIKRHSRRDAEMIPKYNKMMYKVVGAVKPILGYVPPNPASPGLRGMRTLWDFLDHLKSLDKQVFEQFSKIMTMSADDFLSEWVETDVIRAVMGISGIIGTMLGVKSPGTAYVLLHHYMGELDGAFTAWGSQKGGTGGVSEALASAARSYGAEIRCNARVEHVIVKNGRAIGVVLEGGEEIYAKTIASAADPYVTFRKLIDEKELPDDFVSAIDKFKFRGSSGKVNLALDTMPKFSAMTNPMFLGRMMEISPSVDYIERAYDDAKYGSFSKRPFVDVNIPTINDPSMAPPGKHVMSCFVQYASYDMPEHGDRNQQRDAFGNAVIDTLAEFIPNLKDIILHKQVLTPWDIEQEIGLTEGNIFAGELTLDQLFFFRPVAGWADFRTPIRNYYQCGSGTHPGGGITSGPGRLGALEILRDGN
ncbi:MAG: NAD(P)/FAD-dependent oxidoreductase [Deltaproteobacteria bacterium]|jgi:phytoene dehydrogenase-like protein|nr:NAD(P)/FAD-dependent oxidoreductase [Deltaproteobacteria bacterium]